MTIVKLERKWASGKKMRINFSKLPMKVLSYKILYKTVINADFPGRLARICIEVSFSKYFQSGIGLPAGLY